MCSAFLVFCVYWPGSFGKIIKNAFCSLEMACDGPFLGWAFPSRVPLNLAIGVSGLQGVGDWPGQTGRGKCGCYLGPGVYAADSSSLCS